LEKASKGGLFIWAPAGPLHGAGGLLGFLAGFTGSYTTPGRWGYEFYGDVVTMVLEKTGMYLIYLDIMVVIMVVFFWSSLWTFLISRNCGERYLFVSCGPSALGWDKCVPPIGDGFESTNKSGKDLG